MTTIPSTAVPPCEAPITSIQPASSQPETSDHRPDTRNPPSTTTARPDGRVALAKRRRASLNSAVRTASEAYRLATFETVTRLVDGARMGPESSLNKIFWSEMDLRMHETALRLLGERHDEGWLDGFLFSLSGPIYAGTNEIQRNVIAERVLGLPRS